MSTSGLMPDMDDWFDVIAANRELSTGAVQALHETGFIAIPGPVPPDGLARLAAAYDYAGRRDSDRSN